MGECTSQGKAALAKDEPTKLLTWEIKATYKEITDKKSESTWYNPMSWNWTGRPEGYDGKDGFSWINPLSWPLWGKWVGALTAIGLPTGGYFGYQHFYGHRSSGGSGQKQGMSKLAMAGIGAGVVGAGAYGAYTMGYFGDQQEGFVASVKHSVTGSSSDPNKPKPGTGKKKGGSSFWVWVIVILVILAACGGGAYYYFVMMADESEEGDIEEALGQEPEF